MRMRCLPRNREGRSRSGAPERASRDIILRRRLNHLPYWVRNDIKEKMREGKSSKLSKTEEKRVLHAPMSV